VIETSTRGGGETTTSTWGCSGDDDGNINQLPSKCIVTGLWQARRALTLNYTVLAGLAYILLTKFAVCLIQDTGELLLIYALA